MKNVGYRNAWAFLDGYRGKEFQGKWPGVNEMFHISVLRFPDHLAFHSFEPETKLTFAEAERRIMEIAGYLQSTGFQEGDKAAVSGRNSTEWTLAYFAIIYAGGIVVPLDYSLKDSEMERFISFGGVKRLFIDSERVDGIDKDGSLGLIKYSIGHADGYQSVDTMNGEYKPLGFRNGSDVAAILFTSGTTGTPKGVMLTHDNLVSDCFLTQSILDIRDNDVMYAILPIHHAYAMMAVVYISISCGAAVVFGRKLAMSHIIRELKDGKVTVFMAVPMLYNKMIGALMSGVRKKGAAVYCVVRALMGFSGFMKKVFGINVGRRIFHSMLAKLSLDNLRLCISGGGPLPPSTFRMFQELGLDFLQGYGLTEASPVTHLNPSKAFRVESVGKLFPEEEVKIVDPDSDGNGLIYIKGPMVMKGYYHNEEATMEVLTEDGWLNTGDVGHQDKDGYLYLTGRAKNVIVTEGGKNIFPEEIEDHFQLFSEIDQVCVVGYMADEALRKEGIRILIRPTDEYRESMKNDEAAIARHMNDLVEQVNRDIQHYKRITKVTIVTDKMPMTSTSKIKRSDVMKLYG